MRMPAIPLLLMANAALGVGLAALWFTPEGQPRVRPWAPPAAIVPEAPAPLAQGPLVTADAGAVVLQRPLFAPDRRPPPPPEAIKTPPPDPLANVQLTGLLQGEFSGILARVDGQPRRVRLNETIGPWTLSAIDGRKATFKRDGEERTLELAYARLGAPVAAAVAAAAPASPAASGGAPPTLAAVDAAASGLSPSQVQAQRLEEARAERVRRRNETRAKAGLPPVQQ